MPVGIFVGESLSSRDILKKLIKTTRPFYHKSLELVIACRRIPPPASNNITQIEEWNTYVYLIIRKRLKAIDNTPPHRLLEGLESTLALGVTALRDKDKDTANETYEYQYRQVNAYIQRYQGPKAEQLKWEEVAKKDRVAGGLMKKVKAEVHTKVTYHSFIELLFF
jgi:hypothetical protein